MHVKLDRLPFLVILLFAAAAVVGMPIAYSLGWLPEDSNSGRTILLWYFGVGTACLGSAFLISGNTIHHHYLTGTVQRRTSPRLFRWITASYFAIAALLIFMAVRLPLRIT